MRWLLFTLFLLLFEWYAFQALKTVTQNRYWIGFYILLCVSVLGFFFWQTMTFDRTVGMTRGFTYGIGFFLSLLVFQLVVVLILFFEDIFRLPQALYSYFVEGTQKEGSHMPGRRKIISQIALGLAAIPFASLLYGMYRGKYNYKVLRYALEYEDLPEAFDNFTITQISDIHSGSFDNAKKVNYGVDLINEQGSDVILFTGDLVNNTADEIMPWINTFSKLEARYGKFSVMGNHDYGDYMRWDSEEEKEDNLRRLFDAQKRMGFDLLLNESRYLEKDSSRIAIVGVENWGENGFKQAGDLHKAVANIQKDDFKILMSHDPSHWEAQVLPHSFPFHLTLSGHTHGMQFGIEIPGWFKWSPVQWRYKQWAGIYEKGQQRINVNRGFGFLAYPGRVGMWPEISVITLKRKAKDV